MASRLLRSEPVTDIAPLLGWGRLIEFLERDPDQKHRFFKPGLMHVLHPGEKPGISVPFVEQQHPCISSEDKRRRDNLHMIETARVGVHRLRPRGPQFHRYDGQKKRDDGKDDPRGSIHLANAFLSGWPN